MPAHFQPGLPVSLRLTFRDLHVRIWHGSAEFGIEQPLALIVENPPVHPRVDDKLLREGSCGLVTGNRVVLSESLNQPRIPGNTPETSRRHRSIWIHRSIRLE